VNRNVLDKGWVELQEFMGSDQVILGEAKTCTEKEARNPFGLMLFMLKHGHNVCFEHAVFRFKFRAPIFVARQHMRHRIGTFTERSGRKCGFGDFYVPDGMSTLSKAIYCSRMTDCLHGYQTMVGDGMKREQARGVLGTAFYTEYTWTVNLWSLFNWLNKRREKGAQWEHRQYADAVLDILNSMFEFEMVMKAYANVE